MREVSGIKETFEQIRIINAGRAGPLAQHVLERQRAPDTTLATIHVQTANINEPAQAADEIRNLSLSEGRLILSRSCLEFGERFRGTACKDKDAFPDG